jgi:hypothetical protein
MTLGNEKNVLVHWYYSVSEWESYITRERNKGYNCFLKGFVIGCVVSFPVALYGFNTLWIIALTVSCVIALLFGTGCYFISRDRMKWKQVQPPEIIITSDQASVNGKLTIFNGEGKLLRKADIKEKYDRNVLEIIYESKNGNGAYFDELIIPVPKGKLREAIALLDLLNYPRGTWSLYGKTY